MSTICFPSVGDDPIFGSSLRDRLYGAVGDDRLFGLGGSDKLVGEAGKDTISGGRGSDILTGDGTTNTSFSDVFVFREHSGKDVITDFEVGKDIVVISKGINGIKTAEDVLYRATQKGKDVVIDLGSGNKVTLKNTDLDDLRKHPSDHFDVTGA